jgi:phosphoribosyl 1,2-cyclic phosphodiesterase
VHLSVYSLASGSSGNCIAVRAGETILLVDAGLPVRSTLRFLEERRLDPARIAGILLSHEHTDHVSGAGALARRLKVPLVCNASTRAGAVPYLGDVDWLELGTGDSLVLGDLEVESFRVCHDAADPVGFNLYTTSRKMTVATDLGCPLDPQICAGSSLVVLESNHCEERLERSRYSETLKARIRGHNGHLSNAVATRFICDYLQEHPWTCFWLAHLSDQNNSPRLALQTCKDGLAEARITQSRITVAKRDKPSAVWHSENIAWQPELLGLLVDG